MTIHEKRLQPNADQLFRAFKNINVLVVGDVMVDRYLTGAVDRVSPEAPVPVVRLLNDEDRLGGAANVALNLKSLGATPYLCSVIGNDMAGKQFLRLLPEHGISTKYMLTSFSRRTTIKTRIIASNQHLLRVDNEDKDDLDEIERKTYLKMVREILDQREIHVILFQDYNKGVLSSEVIREITLEAIKQDIPTVVDPKKKNFWEFKRATVFKPNLREVAAQVPFDVTPSLQDLSKVADTIRRKLGNQNTMITLSEHGIFIDEGDEGRILPTNPRKIVDVCGAGDAVISVTALGIALGLSMKTIATLSNIAGGQVCEKVGVAAISATELQSEYEAQMKRTFVMV